MPSKSRQQVKASQKLATLKAADGSKVKVLRTTDGDVFVCKQGDKADEGAHQPPPRLYRLPI